MHGMLTPVCIHLRIQTGNRAHSRTSGISSACQAIKPMSSPASVPHSKRAAPVSYCASWGGWGRNSVAEPVSSVAEQVRVAGGGGLVEPFVLVVGFVGGDQAGAAPVLDGGGVHAEVAGDFGDGEHASRTESFRVAGEPVFLSDVNDNCCCLLYTSDAADEE